MEVTLLLVILFVSGVQTQCPQMGQGFICDPDPSGTWISNVTERRSSPNNMARREISWTPDPQIPPDEPAYVVVSRNMELPESEFVISRNTSMADMFILEGLEFDTRYEVFVCYENISLDSLEANSTFLPECGNCRTCFNSGARSTVMITSATEETRPDGSGIYECFATSNQPPVRILWTSNVQDGRAPVRNNTDGDIFDAVDGNRTSSMLITPPSSSLSMIECEATDGIGDTDTVNMFEPLRNAIRITLTSVHSSLEGDTYECRATGDPLPITITWTAVDINGANIILSNDNATQIETVVSGSETQSILEIPMTANLDMLACEATNGNGQRIIDNTFNMSSISVTGTVESGPEGDTFVCVATGEPLPLRITWSAVNGLNETVPVNNGIDGIEITEEEDESPRTSALLRGHIVAAVFTMPFCTAMNGFNLSTSFDAFTEITTTVTTQSTSFPVYAIVLLVVIPFFILLSVSGLFIFFCWYKCRTRRYFVGMKKELEMAKSSQDSPNEHNPVESSIIRLRERLNEDKIITPSELNVSVIIGQGEFGVIYKAYLSKPEYSQIVAVKTLKGIFTTASDVEKATEEILKMSHFNHINVMSLIGVCMAPSDQESVTLGPSIVMAFMAKGSLLDYLRKESDNLIAKTEDEVVKVRKPLLQMCLQVAKGMEYLAGLKFIHRDLAARNCLMDADGIIKVSDFGLTENVYSRNYFRQARDGAKLPLKWMALESIKVGIFTEKTDVWSYGVTCWEIFSGGAIPYPGIHPQEILNLIEEGQRLRKPRNEACCPDMYKLMRSCWDVKSDSRPAFSQIVPTMEHYLEITSDYIDLQVVMVENTEGKANKTAEASLRNRIPSSPNDYCVADSV